MLISRKKNKNILISGNAVDFLEKVSLLDLMVTLNYTVPLHTDVQ